MGSSKISLPASCSGTRPLAARPFVRLGEISFALYLVHLTLLHYVGNLAWVKPLTIAAQVGVYIAVVLAAAWLVFRTVETYGIGLGKRIAARIRQVPARYETSSVLSRGSLIQASRSRCAGRAR